MEQLEAKLQEFFGAASDPVRKKAIEQELLAYKDDPHAFTHARQYLEASRSPYLQWFAASVLEDTVARKWHTLSPTVREQVGLVVCQTYLPHLPSNPRPSNHPPMQLRVFLLTYLTTDSDGQGGQRPRLEPFVASKLQKVLVDLGKQVGGWPQAYPTFVTDIVGMCQSPHTYGTGLSLLAMCAQEFMRDDLPLPSARKAELQAAFTRELPAVVQLLSSLLTHAHEPSAAAAEVAVQSDLACCALRCLSILVEWPAMAACLTPELCANVFRVVQAAVRPGTEAAMLPSGLAAVAVMTELMNRRCLPPQLEAFVMEVALGMAKVLESLCALTAPTQNDSSGSVDEDLLLALLEFLTVFLEQHLGRVLALPAFPFAAFGQLLGKFTFEQLPNARLLQRAFVPWSTLLEHLTESEAGLAALQESQGLFSAVAAALLQKLLFVTNGAALAELDEDESGNGGRDTTNTALQLMLEDDQIGNPQAGGGGGGGYVGEHGVLGGEMSEQQEVIGEGVALLQSFVRLPSCSNELAGQVLQGLDAALRRLEANEGEQAHVVVDCTTLLRLVIVVVPNAPAEPFWATLRLVLSSTQQMNHARLHARGPAFLRMHCAALVALKDLSRGFVTATMPSSSPSPSPAPDLGGVVSELVGVIRSLFDPSSAAPELLQLEAASLLLGLAQKLPARHLRGHPAIDQLLNDAYRLVGPLPLAVQEKALQAISLLLLPNTGRPDPEEEASVAAAYIAFVQPVVAVLKEAQAQLGNGAAGGEETFQNLRRAARLLRCFCALYAQTPKRTKALLYGALLPGLSAILPCLDHCLRRLASPVGAAAALAAQALLGLLLALHTCFGKELGPSLMTEAVQLFVGLFSAPDFSLGVSDQASCVAVFLLAALLRLLRQISADRTSTPPGIVMHICQLTLDKLLPLVRAAPADLLPLLLRLLGSLLSDHWKEFMATTTATPPSSSDGQHYGMGESKQGDVGLVAGIAGGGSKKQFVSCEMQGAFDRMLLVVYECLQDTILAPGTVRLAIELLQQLNRDLGLFRLDYFRATMRLPYGLTVLQLLLARAHPLLRDELLALLRDVSVGVETGGTAWFFDMLLPQALVQTDGVSDEQRGALLASVPRDVQDGPSFATHIAAFVGDVIYARMVAQGTAC